MARDSKKQVEGMLKMSPEELRDVLPSVLDGIRKHGSEKMLAEVPDCLAKIIRRLVEIDAAQFANNAPEAFSKFMDFFWETAGTVAEKSEELRLALEAPGQVHCNLEANDSPFATHFGLSAGKLSGGWGLWHFRDQDLKYYGPTKVLMGILTGDVDLHMAGFTSISVEGLPKFQIDLTPVVAKVIPRIARGGE